MQPNHHYHIGDWIAFYGNAAIKIRSSMDGKLAGMSLLIKALPPGLQIAMIKADREHTLPDRIRF